MKVKSLRFVAIVICEQVRREDNGKEIILGVFGNGIQLNAMPGFIAPVIWLQIETLRVGEIKMNIRLTEKGTTLFEAQGLINAASAHDISSIAIQSGPLQIPRETKIKIEAQVDGSQWTSLRELPVLKMAERPGAK